MHFDLGRNEVIEVIDHGVTALPEQHARYYPEDHQPLRDNLKPLEITQPEGPSFTVDGNLIRWSQWSLRIGFDPYEGLTLHQVTYDDHGRERSVLHRASVTEMVVPYGDPSTAARLEERVRRGRVGARAHDPAAHARLRLRRRDPLLRRGARERHRRSVHDHQRDLPARGGLRDPLEARRPVQRPERGAAQPPARHQLRRDRRQLRVRVLLVPLPRRQHPARGEAHRHRVADGDRAGDGAGVRERRRARRRRAAPPAHVQRATRLRRRRP